MVLVKPEKFKELYDMIKGDAVGGRTTLLMLVATDCDSLCACRILSALLQADSVLFTIRPVSGHDDLTEADSKLINENDELKSIVMINCGATVKILDFLALKNEVLVYLIDSHRPYVVENILNESHIVILDDGTDSEKLKGIIESKRNKENNKKRAYREDDELRIYGQQPLYYGNSASSVMFELAVSVNKDSLDGLLWYAIVGMTDQLVHERVSPDEYSKEAEKFHRQVNNAYLGGDEMDLQADRPDRISTVDEFRFPLYRHWNLYDSMYHSRYVATNMKLWRPNGRNQLDTLLARMGIPLEECKQKYLSMSIDLKKKMKEMFALYCREFKIPDIYYKSFQRQHGFKEMQSASDTVFAVTALLEADAPDQPDGATRVPTSRNANFFAAYDALSSLKDQSILRGGLDLAIKQQQAIVRQGISIMEKKITVMSGPFRYTLLTESPDLHFFVHPLALSRLALFLIDIIAKAKVQIKPLVICALNEKKNSYIVVGVANHSTLQYNFKASFNKAIVQTRATVAHHSFDGSVVEVSRDDVTKFIEYLHSSLVE